MLSVEVARAIVQEAFPNADIRENIDYRGEYIFVVMIPMPLEEGYDPFIAVNQETGELRDYSIITDGDISETMPLFVAAQGGVVQ